MFDWKKLFFLFLLMPFLVYATTQDDIEKFKNSWTAKALKLQRDIDLNAPLNQATFLGTHNSENSASYAIPLVRYVDPNQMLSIYDQLEMGVRSIELDVHWFWGRHGEKDILLCHALDDHLGCSFDDRPVSEGLTEIQNWLAANPNEILILYFDRALDGHEPRLTSYLETYLGSFIFKPSMIRKDTSCLSLPTTLTKATILNAGKQLLIVTKDCDGSNPAYEEQDQFKLLWNDYVFAGIGSEPPDAYTILDTTIDDDFKPYPECANEPVFTQDPAHDNVWRIFEDRTQLANIGTKTRKIQADDMRELMRCGINMPTLDMLTVDDDRLPAAVWSWATDFPKENQGDCAFYQLNEGIKNTFCSTDFQAFACENQQHQLTLSLHSGFWSDGEARCQLLGNEWHFSMPMNGNRMQVLKEMVASHDLLDVAINYAKNSTGSWVSPSF